MVCGGFRSYRRSPHSFAWFLALLAFLAILNAPTALAGPSDFSYLSELIHKAVDARLADAREWHLLLHYRQNFLGGYTSEQDGPNFFLAPDGKTNPQTELEATLAKFFSDDLIGEAKQPVQCAFIARYHWLKEIGRASCRERV